MMKLDFYLEKFKEPLGDFFDPAIRVVQIIGVIFLAFVAVRIGSFILKKLFEKRRKFHSIAQNKRADTAYSLIISIYKYIIYGIAIVVILSDILQSSTILAAAGIGGVALGLGAQSLIKDFIAGFFIVLEDQFVVGDLVTIDNMNGTVEEMDLRVTKFRNINGDLYIIPNGEIKKVTNHTRGNKAVIVDIPVAYSSDLGKAAEIAAKVCRQASEEFDTLVEPPQVLGVTALGRDNVTLRIFARTFPNEQWAVERRIRMLIKEEFDKEHVEFFDKNKIIAEDDS